MTALEQEAKIEAYFIAHPLTTHETNLLKSNAIGQFLSSAGETLEEDALIFDYLAGAEYSSNFHEEFEQATGIDFVCLERYECFDIYALINNITELFDSLMHTTKAVIAERCVK